MQPERDLFRRLAVASVSSTLIALASASFAAGSDAVTVNAADIKWGDAPPVLPKGAKVAVLYGDPSKSGPICMRLMMPAGYKIPAHWHSQAEALTIISGTFYLGMGDKMDPAAAHALKTGGFHYLPAKQHHFAYTKGPTVVQLNGEGPFDMTYLDAADDPQKAAKH
jgi:quercetin dioxygenase-like cupin family protein